MNKNESFITIKIEGPAVSARRISLASFASLCEAFLSLARRIAKVQAGYTDSSGPGRAPEELEKALALDLVGFTEGSPAAVALFERSPAPEHYLDGLDPGALAYRNLVVGLASDFSMDNLPPGFDTGVLMGLRDLGAIFDKGIARIDVSCVPDNGLDRAHGSYTPAKREAVRAAIARPEPSLRSFEGRLVMADFGEGKRRLRIEPPFGDPIQCDFEPDILDNVYENILGFVRVRGSVAPEKSSGRWGTMHIIDIERLPTPGVALPQSHEKIWSDDFWHFKDLEALATEQGVPTSLDFEDYLGGWPEDEVHDGFEVEYDRPGEIRPNE